MAALSVAHCISFELVFISNDLLKFTAHADESGCKVGVVIECFRDLEKKALKPRLGEILIPDLPLP